MTAGYPPDLTSNKSRRSASLFGYDTAPGGMGREAREPVFVSLASLIAVFQMMSEEEYKKIQKRFAAFRDVPFEVIRDLVRAQAMVAAVEASDPSWVRSPQGVYFRPPHTENGGESMETP